MTQDKLNAILDKHTKWMRDEDGGNRATLSRATLSGADLRGADLRDMAFKNKHRNEVIA